MVHCFWSGLITYTRLVLTVKEENLSFRRESFPFQKWIGVQLNKQTGNRKGGPARQNNGEKSHEYFLYLNPFMPSGIFYLKSLVRFNSYRRGSGQILLLPCFIEIPVFLRRLIWVYTVCHCPFYGTLGLNGLRPISHFVPQTKSTNSK